MSNYIFRSFSYLVAPHIVIVSKYMTLVRKRVIVLIKRLVSHARKSNYILPAFTAPAMNK